MEAAAALRSVLSRQVSFPGVMEDRRASHLLPALLFVGALAMPPETSFVVGGLRLSPYRLVLLACFVRCARCLLSGEVGARRLPDVMIVLHALWAGVALIVAHGIAQAAPTAGIYFVESVGAYLLGRTCVRNERDLERVVWLFTVITACLVVVTLPEAVTGKHFVRDVFRSMLGGTPPDEMGKRYGLTRAFGPFEHPILHGVFCAVSVGMSLQVLGGGAGRAAARTCVLMVATITTVSSGAIVSALLQLGMIVYDRATAWLPGRWYLLAGAVVAGLIAVGTVSSRPPHQVLMTSLALSRETAYTRMEIFNYGSLSVAKHPLFGIGLADWERPDWMPETGSVDNFWLLTAMRYGIPALLLLAGAMAYVVVRGATASKGSPESLRGAKGLIFAVVSVSLAGTTVHFWNALFTLFFFLLGCGMWATVPGSVTVRPMSRNT
jgi:hypothetical protein